MSNAAHLGSDNLPFTSLPALVFTTVPLVIIWVGLRISVEKGGALKYADVVLRGYQLLISQVSLILGFFILDIGHEIVATRPGLKTSPTTLGYLYHILKITEYLDIILPVASGTSTVSKYTAFSRLFMPFWSFYRIIDRPQDSVDWRMQAVVDCLGRFAVFTVPYLVDDVATEEPILAMCEEFRWYPDLAIFGFWAWFTARGERQSKKGFEVFGSPYADEPLARIIGLAIVLYASFLKRQEDRDKGEQFSDTDLGDLKKQTEKAKDASTELRQRGSKMKK